MSNYAVVCLDETGSMTGQEERVVSSMNEYVDSMPEGTHVSVFKFNSDRWTQFFGGKKEKWPKMEVKDYQPESMTPLYDSVAKTIRYAEGLTSSWDKVMVMIDTDGFENASKEYKQEAIKAMVEQKKALGWEFLFMANALDRPEADRIGAVGAVIGMNVMSNVHQDRVAAYGVSGAQGPEGPPGAAGATRTYFNT